MVLYVLIAAGVELGPDNAWLCWEKSSKKANSSLDERLNGAKARVSQRAAQAFVSIVALVEMVIVKECIELSMKGLNLSLRTNIEVQLTSFDRCK